MTKDEFHANVLDILYLTRCVVNQEIPDKARVESMNQEQLYEAAQRHSMTAVTAFALESAGIRHKDFTEAKEKALRKNIIFDAERKKILQKLEDAKIWYIPLKGAILKDYYPKMGMRQMTDNDILFDASRRENVREIMLNLGFTVNHFGVGYDDAYFKKPVCNFEMHSTLFSGVDMPFLMKMHEYYENIRERLLKDENNQYGYHFSDEDFYLYMIAHEYKHYAMSGTGVRSLLDMYIFLRKFQDSMNWEYILAETQKLGIADYEQKSRKLAFRIFTNQELTPDEKEILDYYIFSEAYGTSANFAANRAKSFHTDSQFQYIFHRIFPPMEIVQMWYPFFYKYKIFLPVLWFIVRPFKALTVKKSLAKEEMKQLKGKSDSGK